MFWCQAYISIPLSCCCQFSAKHLQDVNSVDSPKRLAPLSQLISIYVIKTSVPFGTSEYFV